MGSTPSAGRVERVDVEAHVGPVSEASLGPRRGVGRHGPEIARPVVHLEPVSLFELSLQLSRIAVPLMAVTVNPLGAAGGVGAVVGGGGDGVTIGVAGGRVTIGVAVAESRPA